MNPARPLSEREIDELDRFLVSEAVGEDCMDVATLHGFLTALAIGPGLVLPSEWLRAVWGSGPEFESEKEAARIFGMMIRPYDGILRTLQETPEKFLPIIVKDEMEDGKLGLMAEPWCEGFVEGMFMRKKEWEPLLLDEEGALVLSPILAFVDREAMKEILASAKAPKPTREEIMAMIPMAVAAIYSYWLEKRVPLRRGFSAGMAPATPRSRLGRNDPCPCGSGKKYKKCCALRPV